MAARNSSISLTALPMRRSVLAVATWIAAAVCAAPAAPAATGPPAAAPFLADGRAPLARLHGQFDTLRTRENWLAETVYTYADEPRLSIDAWRTRQDGAALWILAGIHGEEPAGPNALAEQIESVAALASTGVPVVMIPMCNPRGYWRNWRYPATSDRDWKGGGYSVGDAEYLLPKLAGGAEARAAKPPGPETEALTGYVLRTAERYPPLLVLDFHEDELSVEGGYVYWQGWSGEGPAVAREIVRLLQSAGVSIRISGRTRFDETIENGIIGPNGVGQLFNDGSIDELLAAPQVIVNGKAHRGPAAPIAIAIETPANPGSALVKRIAGHRAVIARLRDLWLMSGGVRIP
jgi:hypothetical protein